MAAAIARLKELAGETRAALTPYNDDGSDHYRIFSRAVTNVLSTELALFTFAQIVDGLPIADVAYERRFHGLGNDHPIEDHVELCPGVVERTREIGTQFEFSDLLFNPAVCWSRSSPTALRRMITVENSRSRPTAGHSRDRKVSRFGS
jgi:hypothetical protein